MIAPTTPRRALPSPTRRRLLQALVASGLVAAAERNRALAQSAADYKALVCVFLQGGNDGENTLIRYDNAGYQQYAGVRPAASGLQIAQGQLHPIQPALSPVPYGLHPACGPLKPLFDQKRLAVVANMGVIAQPTVRAALENGTAKRPANLFSHSDQEQAMHTGDASGFTRSGWGGRATDRLEAASPETLFPAMTSINQLRIWSTGVTSIPLTVPEGAGATLYSSMIPNFDPIREAALRQILALPRANAYDYVAQVLAEEGLAAASVVAPILSNAQSVVAPHFVNATGPLGRQLKSIAMLIEGRAQTGVRRQMFYAHQGGYDTHGAQAGIHHGLLDDLSRSLAAFDAAMIALGTASQVTAFTLSDFGRTYKPAANAGTDHGWGGYAFALGGAVKGGQFHGTVPNHAPDGPDDFGKDGRWIPTTSLDTYGATLLRWLGIAEGDLPYVFPNLGAFPVKDLGLFA